MKPYIFISNTSGTIETAKISVYYGPDKIDENSEEWCFTVEKNGKEVARYSNSTLLDVACGESLKDMIIAGLSLYLGR